jgi:hypothetical protein
MALHKGQTNSGSFKKGEHRSSKTEFKKGYHFSPITEFGKVPAWNKGLKGEEYKKHFKQMGGQFKKGFHSSPKTEIKKGQRISPITEFTSERMKGYKHHNWKGGITPFRIKIWHSEEYKLWRKAVFERDNFTCIWCGRKGGRLQADHIKPFALFPELRFAIDNGRTLCEECHKKTDTYGGKIRNYAKRRGGDE